MIGKIFNFGNKIDKDLALKTKKSLEENKNLPHQLETFTKTENIINNEDKQIKILRKFADKKAQLIEIKDGNQIDIIDFNENGEVTETRTEKKKADINDSENKRSLEIKPDSSGNWTIVEKDEQSNAHVITTLSTGHVYRGKVEVPGKKKLTVLFWGNGSGNLEPLVVRKLLDLEKMGSTEDINIVAQISRAPQEKIRECYGEDYIESNIDGNWSNQARRYYVTKGVQEENPLPVIKNETIDSPVIENRGNVNMGDKAELLDFLLTEMKEYPAEHYMVVFFDHGQGWRGINPDENSIGSISPEDMGNITEKVKETTGKKLDLMVMENCLEGQAEALYPMKDTTDYLVASPEVLWGSAYTDNPGPVHLREALELIQKNERRELDNPKEAAIDLIRATANKNHAITLTVIDSDKLQGIAEDTKKLKDSMATSGISGEKLREIVAKAQQYELLDPVELRHGYVDMGDLAENIEKTVDDGKVKHAARQLKESLGKAVVAEMHMQGDAIQCDSDDGEHWMTFEANVKRCHGLAMNFGIPGSDTEKELYKNLSFNIATGWDEIVNKAEWNIRNG